MNSDTMLLEPFLTSAALTGVSGNSSFMMGKSTFRSKPLESFPDDAVLKYTPSASSASPRAVSCFRAGQPSRSVR